MLSISNFCEALNLLIRIRLLTVFPLVVATVAFEPLISVTSPSIQASSGSSIHTWDPTMMFTGVPWITKDYYRGQQLISPSSIETEQDKLLIIINKLTMAVIETIWSWNSKENCYKRSMNWYRGRKGRREEKWISGRMWCSWGNDE